MDVEGLGMGSLRLGKADMLSALPLDILLIICTHFGTARSFASLASTCRRLCQVVRVEGWRIFVRTQFGNLTFPAAVPDDGWAGLARTLTWQSEAWDKRAFVLDTLAPPRMETSSARGDRRRGRRGQGHPGQSSQTVPFPTIVSAHIQSSGPQLQETVLWGAGEDVVARFRQKREAAIRNESWHTSKGAAAGFLAGRDDITSVLVLERPQARDEELGALVGRASGDLRLLSLDPSHFGRTLQRFRPSADAKSGKGLCQADVQSFDVSGDGDILATSTKNSILLYPLRPSTTNSSGGDGTLNEAVECIEPSTGLNMFKAPGSVPFKFARSVKFMSNETLAIGLTSSTQPLRYMTITPTGLELHTAAKMLPSSRCAHSYAVKDWKNGTVRGLMSVNASSAVGGGGNVSLSSYDDGTIRLQDLRAPSAIDSIYQDNFEPMNPVGPLVAYGMERFAAGSARSPEVKIFDFRWSKGYSYTACLPCGDDEPFPLPKPPTVVPRPWQPHSRRCDTALGETCRWHALSRMDYYRPNTNVFLKQIRNRHRDSCHVYSLAKSSDMSPNLFAGLAGEVVEMNLKAGAETFKPPEGLENGSWEQPRKRPEDLGTSIIETGDGFGLEDVGQSFRMPEMRVQTMGWHLSGVVPPLARRRHRMDESFQWLQDHLR